MAARPEDAFLRWSVREPLSVRHAGRSVSAYRRHHRSGEGWITAVGDDAEPTLALLDLHVRELTDEGMDVTGVTVPRGWDASLSLHEADSWSFWLIESATPHRPRRPVVPVDHADPRLTALLAHSPSAEHEPGGRPPVRWLGVIEGDALVAVGAQTSLRDPAGHIAAVVTHPSHRGRGLARDVCAELVRVMLDDGCPVVCLGMYSDNEAAARVYSALGFTRVGDYVSGRRGPDEAAVLQIGR